MNISKGFTLAEVLITLGVIGVVAAITLPNVINNIKGKQFSTKYKKTLSTLNQMVNMNKAKYDWDFSDVCGGYECHSKSRNPNDSNYILAMFEGNLKNYTKNPYFPYGVKGNGNGTVLDGDNNYEVSVANDINGSQSVYIDCDGTYLLSDGSLIALYTGLSSNGDCTLPKGTKLTNALGPDGQLKYCGAIIDVNGAKLPNKEIRCSNGTTSWDLTEPCEVDDNSITDVYPIVFYDGIVAPATNAAAQVLASGK